MNVELKRAGLDLERRAIVKLPDAAGIRITCRDGAVWITLHEQLRDIVLEAGDSFVDDVHRSAMIYALKPSSIEMASA